MMVGASAKVLMGGNDVCARRSRWRAVAPHLFSEMVEVNGQPCISTMKRSNIKSNIGRSYIDIDSLDEITGQDFKCIVCGA